MALIKLTEDLADAKSCYLESIKKFGKCVIRRDHKYNIWLIEKFSDDDSGARGEIVDGIVKAVGRISRIKEEIRKKIRVIRKENTPKGDRKNREESKPVVRRASSMEVLGFAPGNAPRIHSRLRPFCGTDEEIKKLRRGF